MYPRTQDAVASKLNRLLFITYSDQREIIHTALLPSEWVTMNLSFFKFIITREVSDQKKRVIKFCVLIIQYFTGINYKFVTTTWVCCIQCSHEDPG